MRIVVLGPYPPTWDGPMNGRTRVIGRLTQELGRLGLEVRVIDIGGSKQRGATEIVRDRQIEVWRVAPYALHRIAEGIRTFAPDVVHLHGVLPPFHVPFWLRRWGGCTYRTVYTVHGVISRELSRFPLRLMMPSRQQASLLRQVDHAVAISPLTRAMVLADGLAKPERVSVITHGADLEWLQGAADAAADAAAASPVGAEEGQDSALGARRVVFVGDVLPIKGLDFLLASLSRLELGSWQLVIAGRRTAYEDELRRLHPQVFAQGLVQFAGLLGQQQLAALYHSAAVCVLPSRFEQFGLAGLEAMGAGKPLIVSDRVGLSCLIESGYNGYVVPFDDSERMAGVLGLLLQDSSLRAAVGQRALATARQETWAQKARQYQDLFRSLAGGH